MRLRFEEIVRTLTKFTKENIEERATDEAEKSSSETETDRINKILERQVGNTNNICTVVDGVYATSRIIEKRKGLKQNEKKKPKGKEKPAGQQLNRNKEKGA